MTSDGMRTADATPHAASLVESLRDIGYSIETALADIIDNSITAKAKEIRLFVDSTSDDPALAIVDDGVGMTEAELVEAMRPGSTNPLDDRDEADLGRFGLGLKSASFSQCRSLTVLTRKKGITSAATWDLDHVSNTNRWEISLHDAPENIRWHEELKRDGTLVLWEKLDRLSGGIRIDGARRTAHINAAIDGAARHLRLVFHRFMEEGSRPLQIWVNGRRLKPIDPFATKHPACQPDPEEVLQLKGGKVTIRSFTLPHHKTMSKPEWDELGGPEGHLKSQGFYVYRGRRLIISGGWLGLARQTELTKLCRIRVDIPNSMDAAWKIDVKKASAQLPPAVRERLKKVVERFTQTSKRTYRKRGQKLTDETRSPMWSRIRQDGRIVYRPNDDHPALRDFAERLPEDLRKGFENCVSLIGAGLPIEALHADMLGEAESVSADKVELDALEQALHAMVPRLLEQGVAIEGIRDVVKSVELFRNEWKSVKPMLDALLAEEEFK